MSSSTFLVVPDASSDIEQIYYYHSSGTSSGEPRVALYLHKNASSQSVEFVSRGAGLTDMHGRWELSADHLSLNIFLNCRDGTSARAASGAPSGAPRTNLPLHPTILHRFEALEPPAPENATWQGLDDKGCVIWLVHLKSFVKFGRQPRNHDTDPL